MFLFNGTAIFMSLQILFLWSLIIISGLLAAISLCVCIYNNNDDNNNNSHNNNNNNNNNYNINNKGLQTARGEGCAGSVRTFPRQDQMTACPAV